MNLRRAIESQFPFKYGTWATLARGCIGVGFIVGGVAGAFQYGEPAQRWAETMCVIFGVVMLMLAWGGKR